MRSSHLPQKFREVNKLNFSVGLDYVLSVKQKFDPYTIRVKIAITVGFKGLGLKLARMEIWGEQGLVTS
jgi:hypothetical protein